MSSCQKETWYRWHRARLPYLWALVQLAARYWGPWDEKSSELAHSHCPARRRRAGKHHRVMAEPLWAAWAQRAHGGATCANVAMLFPGLTRSGLSLRAEPQIAGAGESPAFTCRCPSWLGSRGECPSPGSSRWWGMALLPLLQRCTWPGQHSYYALWSYLSHLIRSTCLAQQHHWNQNNMRTKYCYKGRNTFYLQCKQGQGVLARREPGPPQ